MCYKKHQEMIQDLRHELRAKDIYFNISPHTNFVCIIDTLSFDYVILNTVQILPSSFCFPDSRVDSVLVLGQVESFQ